ncbi:MAG: hypothetical protein LLG40_00065, partial [Deltaproteobacteria bacterium]|nr:hypothetical protein [Deltaproteobacteria bacterium]
RYRIIVNNAKGAVKDNRPHSILIRHSHPLIICNYNKNDGNGSRRLKNKDDRCSISFRTLCNMVEIRKMTSP